MIEEMTESKIRQLTFLFPHHISIRAVNYLVRQAEYISQAGTSEGGFEIIGTTPDGEGLIFSDDQMHYTFGHNRKDKE